MLGSCLCLGTVPARLSSCPAGVLAGAKLKGEQLRALLAVLVLAVAARLLITLVWPPGELHSIYSEGK